MNISAIAAACVLSLLACCATSDTPLLRAVGSGNTEEVSRLLAAGTDPDDASGSFPPLHWAARNGQWEVAQVLLGAGADPARPAGVNDWTPLLHALHTGHVDFAARLLEAAPTDAATLDKALRMAAGYGQVELVRALIARGARPDAEDLTAAAGGAWDIDATWQGCETHEATVRALLESNPSLRLPDDLAGKLARRTAKKQGCANILALVDGVGTATARK